MSELAQKVWAKTLLWTGRNAIIGAIEHPSDDHPYSAWIDVRGWAIGLDARSALTVEFLVGDTLVHTVTPNAPRPDVGARFPGVAGADRCGFDARLTTAVLPWQGATVLTVRAVSESPHKGQAILGTRRIRRQDTIDRARQLRRRVGRQRRVRLDRQRPHLRRRQRRSRGIFPLRRSPPPATSSNTPA